MAISASSRSTIQACIDAFFAATKAVLGLALWSGGRDARPEPERKPHGRLAWSIVCGSGPYLDISVMPPRKSELEFQQ